MSESFEMAWRAVVPPAISQVVAIATDVGGGHVLEYKV